MPLKQRMLQRQVQRMIMSLKMQQSMHMLQLPLLELSQLIAQELDTNPVLEELAPAGAEQVDPLSAADAPVNSLAGDTPQPLNLDKIQDRIGSDWGDDANIWESDFFDRSNMESTQEKREFQQTLITKPESLREELTRQFRILHPLESEWLIAEQLIGNIDEDGYLRIPLEEIALQLSVPSERVDQILALVQELEPSGVGARSLKECLLIQLRRKGRQETPEYVIVEHFLDDMAAKRWDAIGNALHLTLVQVKRYVQAIASLDPRPCRGFSIEAIKVVPDVILEKTSDGFEISVNTNYLPRLGISQLYRNMLKNKKCTEETLTFIREKMKNAENLLNGLTQRQHTLQLVATSVLQHQKAFMETGSSGFNPLSLKQVAQELGIHPSTVSRTVAHKYIQTPYGTFALRHFFSQAVATDDGVISNQNIKHTLETMVQTESPKKPFSDQEIVRRLQAQGIHISRRTVTKYRNLLKIPPAHERRQR